MKAHVHYESAFEDYLRQSGIPYVAVDEAKRASFREQQLKSFDFIVYSARETNWLTDVKGRRWAPRPGQRRPSWQNWVTQADMEGLRQWQELFGAGFRGLFVFAYWIDAACDPPPELVHRHRDLRYVFAGVPLDDYSRHARVRSPKWKTVNLSGGDFARHVRPLVDWL